MAGKRIVIPNYMPALDLNGNPQAGAKITFWANETTDLAPIYTSAALTVQHPNPISADASGVFPSIFADEDTEFSVAITDADDNPIGGLRNRDNIRPSLAFLDGVEAPVSGAMADVLAEDTLPAARATMGTDLAANVNFTPEGTGAIVRTIQAKFRDVMSIADFGADATGLVNNAVALANAREHAALRSFAGKTTSITWQPGLYAYATSPNWGIERLRMHFEGEVWLAKYGTGPAFILDGGTEDGFHNLCITGFPYIYDDGANNHCIYARAIHDSHLELCARSASPAHAGFYGEWLVDNDIHYTLSGLEGGLPSIPGKGMHLTTRGGTAEDSSYNRLRIRVSGFPSGKIPLGVFLDVALGNQIVGTIQNCDLGYLDTVASWENKIDHVDFEANTEDAEVHGQQTTLEFNEYEVGPVIASDAVDCMVLGGSTQNMTVESGATNTLLSSFTYNRRRVPDIGSLVNGSASTRFRDLRNGTDGILHDAPPSRSAVTVGASPFTYTNTSGNQQRVHVYGGTVSSLVMNQFAGDPLLVGVMHPLDPGDSITVTYSSAPAMIVRA